MNLFVGIVGLPNVGKSTLFNTITNLKVEAANYPFATIEPNVGVVNVPDHRLYNLCNLIQPEKITPALCQFVDIAGLVKNAHKGEGLGNQFLSNIREVDAIIQVVRCFSDSKITHVYSTVDPIRDVEIVNLELIMADLDVVNKKMDKIIRKVRANLKDAVVEYDLYTLIKNQLEANKLIKDLVLTNDQRYFIKSDNFLTNKPVLYVANLNEDDIHNPTNNEKFLSLKNNINKADMIIPLSISLEYEISLLSTKEKEEFLSDLKIKSAGINDLILSAYNLLNLSTFFTFGKQEVKAWTFIKNMTAQECAGLIHSDIAKGFIRAEVVTYDDLIKFKTMNAIKEAGLLKVEGKKYLIRDGEVCYFRFNV